jgi:hypothetical protein
MKPQIGEHYYFKPSITGAGVIKRHTGKDMVIWHMQFTGGLCIAEDKYCYNFEAIIGCTKYSFKIGKHGQTVPSFRSKQPRSHK